MAKEPTPNEKHVAFYPISNIEAPQSHRPKNLNYECGACGRPNSGRVLCESLRGPDNSTVLFCICSCERREPSILVERDGQVISQLPNACEFHSDSKWPPELARLYDEAARAYAAGAFTASSMVCRKLLMNCACHEQAAEDLKFVQYVDYVTEKVLVFPRARDTINALKDIGNEANHEVQFVGADAAKRAMQIVTYMLNTIYSLPLA